MILLASLILAFWLWILIDGLRHLPKLPFLQEIEPLNKNNPPRVSIVVAARNEAEQIAAAMQTLLKQDYSNLEIIAVNDRSEDGTGEILQSLSQQHPQLRVVNIEMLPENWLGKNHALYDGAQRATGEYLLFMDADVCLQPSVVSRAVHLMQQQQLDHLTLLPDVRNRHLLLSLAVGTFGFLLFSFTQPWRVNQKNSWQHIGIGAFNLLRRDCYQAIGGHQPIALRPDDDIKLGKLVKQHGFSQQFAFGKNLVELEWYPSLSAMINGLMKNMFAVVNYRVSTMLALTLMEFSLMCLPFFALLLTTGWSWWLFALTCVLLVVSCGYFARFSRYAIVWMGFALPFMGLFMIWIQWRATWLNLSNDGISWRGTHYPLEVLRKNTV